jgi:L-threonylcarbamoyladenylate synthase
MPPTNAAPPPVPASPTMVEPARIDAAMLLGDRAVLSGAVAVLAAGGLVGVPTETVYGLAADATNPAAVAAIYAAKGRPAKNPLIVHCADLAEADRHGVIEGAARRLAEAFWPGPLTLVVPRRPGSPVAAAVTAGLDTVALRVPDAPVVAALARALGRPLAAPSANRSGRVTATDADAVVAELGASVALVIDAGPCPIGVESTIVAVDGDGARLLRAGGLEAAAIEAVLGAPLSRPEADGERPSAPGQLASHYAPRAALRLDALDVRPGEALLAFGPALPPGAADAVAVFQLSETGDLAEAARNLFAGLRVLDAAGAATIAVMPLPAGGLGEALADRLGRAAAPRPALPGESA